MLEHDLPICRVWQIGSRARLQLMVGEWDDAIADADRVLDAPSAPLARTWPSLIRALVALRRRGDATDSLERRLATRVPVRRADPDAARRGGDRRDVHGRREYPTTACPNAASCSPTARSRVWSGRAASWRSGCGGSGKPSTRPAWPSRTGWCSTARTRRQPMSSTGFRCRTTRRSHCSTAAIPRSRPAPWTFSTGSVPTPSRRRCAAIYGPGGSPSYRRAGARRHWPTRRG